jgi:LmbE family N-acetylglucosaminyl deacetylase
VRRREQSEELCMLGVSRLSITRLGIPDGEVADHVPDLTRRLAAMAADFPLVVAPWSNDWHLDHEACGRAAADAVGGTASELRFGLFWTWHRMPPDRFDGGALAALAIPPHIRQQRAHAIAKHRSQISAEVAEPLLTPELLEPLAWDHEFFVVPAA